VPRVALGRFPTPVVRMSSVSPSLWVKRDDLAADPIGGNKVRALEFLMGQVQGGDRLATVGAAGSTHALAVAVHGRRLGARVVVGRWRQEMNDAARVVSSRLIREADAAPLFRTPVTAYLWAAMQRARGARWIPAGGSSALGVLGHVNAALELSDQIAAGVLPVPRYVVVPVGTGGTAAGLTLGFSIAGVDTIVIGARVVPRLVARHGRVVGLMKRAARLIGRHAGERPHTPAADRFRLADESFGGAYGRETAAGQAAAARFCDACGLRLDGTYSAKACAVALTLDDGPVLFWLTFDSRILSAR
jgi:D-cysteine desulfhydrase